MSDHWEPVIPLLDEAPMGRVAWQPRVGDRVRIRLSAECNENWEGFRDPSEPPAIGHDPLCDGLTGRVIVPPVPQPPSHPYGVEYDQSYTNPNRPGRRVWGGAFAAVELNPLDWQPQ